jgi:hypothetical protein
MSTLIASTIGLFSAALWLVILEATDFNTCAVGLGLLAGMAVIGRTKQDHPA